ncbi:Altered inheritance of mitochondria protein 6-like [Pseudocercospora fuligena]|uniref:Altered inheritance of mitochondria protein 6 n=1 Tax=Pseudocercospora fuligena TaxID=685502 RepID=A0A8H6RVE9_9PEZI|nr:Altered inheritance of mitochondria protein 6-like [Pseudocercospora fuligena]
MASKESGKLDAVSDSLPVHYRDSSSSFGDDEEDHVSDYSSSNPRERRRSLVGRLLQVLGMTIRRRKASFDYFSSPRDESADGLLKRKRISPPREIRRCRRSYVAGFLRRACLALPVLVLMFFGLLHILQVLIGRAQLFWDNDVYDNWMPDWGKSGQPGDGLSHYPTDATRDVIPIPCHSHNDYWRKRPLFDAIHWGCTGVEADVWLFDEELYVGHNTASLTKNRTFRNLYINPLVDLLDKMNPNSTFSPNTTGHGVFDEDPNQSLILLVDFKTNGRDTYPYVHKQLEALREKDYLTYHDGNEIQKRPVTVVGTGNTPFDMVVSEKRRDIFFDAPLDKMWEPARSSERSESDEPLSLTSTIAFSGGQGNVGTGLVTSADDFNSTNSYYASVSFTKTVGFVWRGHLSHKQMDIIRGQIRGAQRRGLKARYWDTPGWPINLRNHIWHVLMKEGADMLNVDDLKGAAVQNWIARTHGLW